MKYWNYRVIERRRSQKSARSQARRYVAIHRVTYSDKEKTNISGISRELMLPVSDTKKELARELTLIHLAATKPAVPWSLAKTYLRPTTDSLTLSKGTHPTHKTTAATAKSKSRTKATKRSPFRYS